MKWLCTENCVRFDSEREKSDKIAQAGNLVENDNGGQMSNVATHRVSGMPACGERDQG